jgi:perosamine synthetase
VWAFYPNKQMTTGEGGAVTTHAEHEHELLVSLRNQGRLETSSWLQHGRLGYNYRLDDLSAALGIAQLEKLDRILEARREVAARYDELLRDVDVETPLPDDADHIRSWFVYVVKLPSGVDRNGVMARLAEQGIATAPYLPSIHLQSYMRERYGFREGMLPVSEDCSSRTMALPFHARLDRADQERVVEALRGALVSDTGSV